MSRNWHKDLKDFEKFLENIDVEKYANLKQIKTVEQDLPKELLPLEIYYKYYWDKLDFKDFDEIFEIYWNEKLSPHIYNFIKKYFYGCSLQFVEEGFKARLYRIWMSILTQFHFQYLWNASFEEKLFSSADLDKIGIDAVLSLNNIKIALQIKKISFRREVSDRRFTKRQQKHADLIVEIPYLVIDISELKRKINNPRVKETTKVKCKNTINIFNKNFKKLKNGFVIFKNEYISNIYDLISKRIKELDTSKIKKVSYEEFLDW